MKAMIIAPLCLTALLAACAGAGANVEPILDGPPNARYQDDLAACRALARSQSQLDHETMAAATLGAAAGGALGAIDDDGTALGGAVAGAVAGTAAGASEASDTRAEIVRACLRGRGHAVVG